MRKSLQPYRFSRYCFAVLVASLLPVSTLAQEPVSPPPPLMEGSITQAGGLPGLPSLPGLPEVPTAPRPQSPSAELPLPPLPGEDFGAPTAATAPAKQIGSPVPTPNIIEEPRPPESSDGGTGPVDVGSQQPPTLPGIDVAAPPLGFPAPGAEDLPLPPMFEMDGAPDVLADVGDEPLPKIIIERAKPAPKSWETTLAPTALNKTTNFNYKRHVLPESIYAKQYSKANRHLPSRMTRQDYSRLLLQSVARNDLEATRALLNAGANLNVRNAYGETPLALAKRAGARDVAALLVARGGR
jgi:hypothetical protein